MEELAKNLKLQVNVASLTKYLTNFVMNEIVEKLHCFIKPSTLCQLRHNHKLLFSAFLSTMLARIFFLLRAESERKNRMNN